MGVEELQQVSPAGGPLHRFVGGVEDPDDLLVQFIAVGDDDHAGVGDVLAYPPGQPHHRQAFPTALGMPDDAAPHRLPIQTLHPRPRRLNAEKLVGPADLFHARVEEDEVFDDFVEALRVKQLGDFAAQQIRLAAWFLVLPGQVVFLGRQRRTVAEALAFVGRDQQLAGREEVLDVQLFVVAVQLADGLFEGDRDGFQLDDAQRDAVNVQDHIGPFPVRFALHADLFGAGEIIELVVLPIDEIHVYVGPARAGFDLGAVAEQFVNVLVDGVKLAGLVLGEADEFFHRGGGYVWFVASPQEVISQ